jgi:hypothetical protein
MATPHMRTVYYTLYTVHCIRLHCNSTYTQQKLFEKTKYMLLSRHHNAGQNRDIKIANRSFENVSQFKYLGTTVTNTNLIQEEIKRRSKSGNACCHSVHLLSSRLLSKNLRIRIYKTIILPVSDIKGGT